MARQPSIYPLERRKTDVSIAHNRYVRMKSDVERVRSNIVRAESLEKQYLNDAAIQRGKASEFRLAMSIAEGKVERAHQHLLDQLKLLNQQISRVPVHERPNEKVWCEICETEGEDFCNNPNCVVSPSYGNGTNRASQIATVNEHRTALGYPPIDDSVSDSTLKSMIDSIERNAAYGNDPFAIDDSPKFQKYVALFGTSNDDPMYVDAPSIGHLRVLIEGMNVSLDNTIDHVVRAMKSDPRTIETGGVWYIDDPENPDNMWHVGQSEKLLTMFPRRMDAAINWMEQFDEETDGAA